jgi:hypothetical protein
MNKPVLFVGLDALLVPSDTPDPVMAAGFAEHARAFLTWATQRYDVRILSDRNPQDVFYMLRKLGVSGDAVSVSNFHDSKVPAIEGNREFHWIDSILIPSEFSWLLQNGHTHRYMSVDPEYGVGLEHKSWLEKTRT